MPEETKTYKVAAVLTDEELRILCGSLCPNIPMNDKSARPYVSLYRKLILPVELKYKVAIDPVSAEDLGNKPAGLASSESEA